MGEVADEWETGLAFRIFSTTIPKGQSTVSSQGFANENAALKQACCQTRTQYQKPWKNIKSTSCPFLPDPARDFLTAIDLEIESLIV